MQKALLCVLACALVASCASNTQQKPTALPTASSAENSALANGKRQEAYLGRCKWRRYDDDLILVSNRDGYSILLPGPDWQVKCDDEQMLFAESAHGMYVSIKEYDPQRRVTISEYLQGIASNVEKAMLERGLICTEPEVREIKAAHQTNAAVFMAVDINPLERGSVQLNYWTARQRQDGIVLDFHVSSIVARKARKEVVDATLTNMERAVGLFSLLEELNPGG